MKRRRITVIALAQLLLYITLSAGCQPTPEKPITINKNDGVLSERLAETSAPEEKYEVPALWEDGFSRGKLTVNIKTKPDVPDVAAYPAVKMQYVPFSQDDVNRFADILLKGQKLYKTAHNPTKGELEDWLIQARSTLQRKIEDPESHGDSVQEMQSYIKELEKQIETAPETADKEYVEPLLQNTQVAGAEAGEDTFEALEVSADLPGCDYAATLKVYNYPDYSKMEFTNGRLYQSLQDLSVTQAKNLETTMQKAKDSAKMLASQLGVVDMVVVKAEVGSALPYIDERDKTQPWDYEKSLEQQGYIIHFRRVYAGIPVTYDPEQGKGSYTNDITGVYAETMPTEYLKVYIDDTGITGVQWEGHMAVGEVVSKNVTLMPFDQIVDAFKQSIFVSNAWREESEELIEWQIDIDSAKLGYFCSAVKDEQGKFMLIPVWDFNGTQITQSDIEKTLLNFSEDQRDEVRKQLEQENNSAYRSEFSLLTLSAVDGSIIDRALGY